MLTKEIAWTKEGISLKKQLDEKEQECEKMRNNEREHQKQIDELKETLEKCEKNEHTRQTEMEHLERSLREAEVKYSERIVYLERSVFNGEERERKYRERVVKLQVAVLNSEGRDRMNEERIANLEMSTITSEKNEQKCQENMRNLEVESQEKEAKYKEEINNLLEKQKENTLTKEDKRVYVKHTELRTRIDVNVRRSIGTRRKKQKVLLNKLIKRSIKDLYEDKKLMNNTSLLSDTSGIKANYATPKDKASHNNNNGDSGCKIIKFTWTGTPKDKDTDTHNDDDSG